MLAARVRISEALGRHLQLRNYSSESTTLLDYANSLLFPYENHVLCAGINIYYANITTCRYHVDFSSSHASAALFISE